MPRTIRNQFDKKLTYENLMKAHFDSRRGKSLRYVDNFMKEYFVKSFIATSYACIEKKGLHEACLDVQEAMKHCKRTWNNYYIIKMDVAK